MNAFQVWLRPLGAVCRVRVDGIENTNWLLDRLRQSRASISEASDEKEALSGCCLEVHYNRGLSRSRFEKLLAAIPEVGLMTEPEGQSAAKQVVI